MNRFFLCCLVMLVGCEQSQVVSTCAPDTSTSASIVASPQNQPCVDHGDCASGECVPVASPDPGFAGVCWDEALVGCEDVAFDAWVMFAFCGEQTLRVCQIELTPEMIAACDPPVDSLAPWIASFQCCDP